MAAAAAAGPIEEEADGARPVVAAGMLFDRRLSIRLGTPASETSALEARRGHRGSDDEEKK